MISNILSSPYWNTILSVAALQTVAVMSPGPDFAIVTRNSILHSRKVGVATGLGITAGILFHMTYLVFGFGYVVSSLLKYLIFIKIAGCLYLCYLGWKSLRSTRTLPQTPESESSGVQRDSKSITARSAFFSGFLTNVLNPKAILFLISLFTLVIGKNTPQSVLIACGILITTTTLAWFLIVSLSFSGWLKDHFLRFGYWIDRITGGFLFFVGAKIGLTCFD